MLIGTDHGCYGLNKLEDGRQAAFLLSSGACNLTGNLLPFYQFLISVHECPNCPIYSNMPCLL